MADGAPAVEPVTIRHVAALDGLRGAAVAGVLVFHGGHLLGGYLGVDLFFVLSGYLITTLLLVESDRTQGVRLGGFWARRARRLLPALAGVLVGVAFYALVLASPDELRQIRGDALATIGYVANWRAVFAGQDYWALFRAPSPLQHTWSLAIEEQFYLVWPLIFVGLLAWWKRAAPKAVLVVALVLAAVSGVLTTVLWDPLDPSRSYYGTDTRAAAVLLGAALAAALAIRGPARSRAGRVALEVVGLAGVAGLAVAWTVLDGQSSFLYHGGLFLCGVAGVAVIAASVHPTRGPVAFALSFRPLCLLGMISYGVYLWHWPVYIVFDSARTGLENWPLLGLQVAITLVIAIASYVVIEQPVRRGALTGRQWSVLTPATAGVVIILVVATTSGAPSGISASSADAIARQTARARSAPPGTQRLMIVGDSVARYLGDGFQQIDPSPPVVALNQAVVACTFPSGAEAVDHAVITSLQSERAIPCDTNWKVGIHRFDPDLVLMVFWTPGDASYRFNGRWLEPCDRAYDELYESALSNAMGELAAGGAHVAIATAPYANFDERNVKARRHVDCVNRINRRVAKVRGAQVVDLFGLVCPSPPKCLSSIMNTTLRTDTVHFRDEGARLVDDWILAQLRAVAPPVVPTPLPTAPAATARPDQAVSARSTG